MTLTIYWFVDKLNIIELKISNSFIGSIKYIDILDFYYEFSGKQEYRQSHMTIVLY